MCTSTYLFGDKRRDDFGYKILKIQAKVSLEIIFLIKTKYVRKHVREDDSLEIGLNNNDEADYFGKKVI